MKKMILGFLMLCIFSVTVNAQSMEQASKVDVSRAKQEEMLNKKKQTIARLKEIGASEIMMEKVLAVLDKQEETKLKFEDPTMDEAKKVKLAEQMNENTENQIKEILGEDMYSKFKEPKAKEVKVAPQKKDTPAKKTVAPKKKN